MAVPVCPDCGTTIEPDWDWCHSCGYDPEGVRPGDWSPAQDDRPPPPGGDRTAPAEPAPEATPVLQTRPRPVAVPSDPHPLDLLRPPAAGTPSPTRAPVTGPLLAPEPEVEHRPLTLDDLRRSGGSGGAAAAAAASPAIERDLPAPDTARPTAPASSDSRPPLFPAPAGAPLDRDDRLDAGAPLADDADGSGSFGGLDGLDPIDDRDDRDDPGPSSAPLPAAIESHPYFDLPYDEPSPAPGSEPEPEVPSSRLRRRKAPDNRPNAASMAMAAGRIPADPSVTEPAASGPAAAPTASATTSTLPPPPAAAGVAAAAVDEPRPSTPAAVPGQGSLGPIVFGGSSSPLDTLPATSTKPKSSPLSVVAILMTIAIAVIVLWPTYQNLVESESGPVLPPSSAGVIGYAPAQADGSRAPIDPQRTASWETTAPADAGFEIDMPGVVVVRTPEIPLESGTGTGTVVSSSTGRGGYAVAAVKPPAGQPWTTPQAAAASILGGFDDVAGNELTVGPSTTVGGLAAVSVTGTVDGVPSQGAVVVSGDRAFLAVAGNASDTDLDRFLTSFRPTA